MSRRMATHFQSAGRAGDSIMPRARAASSVTSIEPRRALRDRMHRARAGHTRGRTGVTSGERVEPHDSTTYVWRRFLRVELTDPN
jgi:hypothetical protein